MVFMEDSVRAAELAGRDNLASGLHLNFTEPLSGGDYPPRLFEQHLRIMRYLRASKIARGIFHPGLISAFDYVVRVQRDEFARLYGFDAARYDGHHHMHLCANVLQQRLLPHGTYVRRNFSFERGEKPLLNRTYRQWQDERLRRRHRVTDFLYPLLDAVADAPRVARLFALSKRYVVEVETHPRCPREHDLLMGQSVVSETLANSMLPSSEVPWNVRRLGERSAGRSLECGS
jgi:hypothetical protein